VEVPLAYLNGRFLPCAEAALPLADLGFGGGVTVADNCRTYLRKLFRWPDHLARFRRDCAACHVPLGLSDDGLTAVAEELVRRNAEHGVELQLVTFATPGPPGGPATLGLYTYPVPVEKYRPFYAEGIHLVTAGCHPLGPATLVSPRVKHRSRLVWWLAEHAVPPGNILTETAIGNVLFVVGGAVVASDPALVLDGISVRVVRELCAGLGIPYREAPLSRSLLGTAAEVLLAGTGFGLAGVRRVDDTAIPWPGPVYRRLLAAWADVPGPFRADR
jgi:branched-chain amino acid aminotransferase